MAGGLVARVQRFGQGMAEYVTPSTPTNETAVQVSQLRTWESVRRAHDR